MSDMTLLCYSHPVIEAQAPQTKFVLTYADGRVECYTTKADALADQMQCGGTLFRFVPRSELVAVSKPKKAKRATKA
jgi:hypothetical protein